MSFLSPGTSSLRFPAEVLRQFASDVFQHDGVPEIDAIQAAEIICKADEWGIQSHGLARLRSYHEHISAGRINPIAKLKIVRERPSAFVVDADNGLGLVTAAAVNRMVGERAESTGSAWGSVFNSNHFGIAGYYASQGLDRDLIGVAMTNTPPLVAPLWAASRLLGTNPIAYAFPAYDEPPVIIDMSTSAISFGAVETAARLKLSIPQNCIMTKDGRPSQEPGDFFPGGMLLPLGGSRQMGGHKGYCLAAAIDLLCGPLAGAGWGPFIPPFPINNGELPARSVGQGVGHFFGAYSLAAFLDPILFRRRVDEWVRTIRSAPPAPQTAGPLIPGDPERAAAEDNRRNGVKLEISIVQDLESLGAKLGLHFP
jgi:LDH2 family malate/lactate/ureidoglycolate dehydrogenase